MDKIKSKLKTSLKATIIFGIISTSWLAIDFLALQSIYNSETIKFNFEWVILLISIVPFVLFHVSVFLSLFYAWKFLRKSSKTVKPEINLELEKNEL